MRYLLSTGAIALLATGAFAQVLFTSSWEAADSPAWNVGNVAGQNGFTNFNTAAGHQVVASPGNAGGQFVAAASGSRLHRSETSFSTTSTFTRLAISNDLSGAWANRNTGTNIARASVDIFLPTSMASHQATHGVMLNSSTAASHTTDLIGGIRVRSSDRAVFLVSGTDGGSGFINFVPRDTWFNIAVEANFDTGQLRGFVNGVDIGVTSQLFDQSTRLGLGSVRLFNRNNTADTASSVAFTDNLVVQAVPEPASLAALGLGLLALARRRRR